MHVRSVPARAPAVSSRPCAGRLVPPTLRRRSRPPCTGRLVPPVVSSPAAITSRRGRGLRAACGRGRGTAGSLGGRPALHHWHLLWSGWCPAPSTVSGAAHLCRKVNMLFPPEYHCIITIIIREWTFLVHTWYNRLNDVESFTSLSCCISLLYVNIYIHLASLAGPSGKTRLGI